MKQILWFACICLVMVACDKRTSAYQIEGKLSNSKDSILFAVFSKGDIKQIDTIICNPDGTFKIGKDSLFESMTLMSIEKKRLLNIYLDTVPLVQISADMNYPELAQISGGRMNEKLTEFKNINKEILIERRNLRNKLNNKTLSNIETGEISSQLINVRHLIKDAVNKFILENRDQEISLILIQRYFLNADDLRKLDDLLASLTPEVRETKRGQWIESYSKQLKRTAVGSVAPDFKIKNINGEEITLNTYRGKFLLLSFAAPWCEMCKEENKYLKEIRKEFPENKLNMLTVTLDSCQDSIRQLAKKEKLTWDLVSDSASYASEMVDTYQISSIPRNYIIDTAGIIVQKSDHSFEIKQLLKKSLSNK